jgi:hypothetical protein
LTDADGGNTTTVATGPGVTVNTLLPDFPSLVAVIVAVPVLSPVATPDADTVATVMSLDAHVTTRPVRTFPLASLVVAVKVAVEVLATLAVDGATATVATGTGVTVTTALPDFPSLVAVTVVVPATKPVTTPAELTLATSGLLDVHDTTRFVTTVPLTSVTVAVSGVVEPTTTLAVAGCTTTVATGGSVTDTDAVPSFPSLVAVIVAVPTATPVTTPPATVAKDVLLDDHVTIRSVTTVPFTSFTVAVSVMV